MGNLSLINFLNSLEKQGLLHAPVNQKIQSYLDVENKAINKLYLTLMAIVGALFFSAGIFALIAHNWEAFGQHVKGALSIMPSLFALVIYYLTITKHDNSVSRIEAASLFLMLMIGASIALVSQVYHMDGDFDKFVIVWLTLSTPLFYIKRASGIAIIYLGLACNFLFPTIMWSFFFPSDFALNERYYFFWIFLFAFLPHFYLVLNKSSNKQSFRAIYLGWITAITLIIALPFAVKAGFIWWATGLLMLMYLIGKKYYAGNISSLGRPFQTMTLFFTYYNLLLLADKYTGEQVFELDELNKIGSWNAEQYIYFVLGIALTIITTYIAIKWRAHEKPVNRYIALMPFFIVFTYGVYMLFDYNVFDIRWLSQFILNLFILGFGINAMIMGRKNHNVLYMIYGLLLTCNLLWLRYIESDISFWLKGLIFIAAGMIYLFIYKQAAEETEN